MKTSSAVKLSVYVIAVVGILMSGSAVNSGAEHINIGGLFVGNGFVVENNAIKTSLLDIEIAPQNTKIAKEGIISIDGNEFFFADDLTSRMLYDGRIFVFSGKIENSKNDVKDFYLFGRMLGTADNESIYTFSGRIKDGNESSRLAYVAKMTHLTKTENMLAKTEAKSVQIDILPNSSKPGNAKYYSQPTLEITPGTTIIWKNNDSVPHRIVSGIGSSYSGNPIKPDGKINSGDILPGESFQITIENLGITRYTDTKYSWMNGVILSIPETNIISLKNIGPN